MLKRLNLKRLYAVKAKTLDNIQKAFCLTKADLQNIIRSFHAEMERGLSGKISRLRMIPTYVARPTGNERGKFIALDLGGTNFRILALKLRGNGRTLPPHVMKFALQKRQITGTGDDLFDFIAGCIKAFMKRQNIQLFEECELGFTFSFPVRQTALASGQLVCWTKGFSAKGVVGKDVVGLLRRALIKRALRNVKIIALTNDTVGTLVAGSYSDRRCDVGVIIGTGTNACYPEKASKIRKMPANPIGNREIIINIEWGNFNNLKKTRYDKLLDASSHNPREQILEKMVSGMYLGEITRLVLADLEKQGILFSTPCSIPGSRLAFRTEHMSAIESDEAPHFYATLRILRGLGVRYSLPDDRKLVSEVCRAVSKRAARISAAAITAVVLKMDAGLKKAHVIAIDGSVYEKHPTFKDDMKEAFQELTGEKASRIRMVLTKDGSGKGAAIIAAVAYASQEAK